MTRLHPALTWLGLGLTLPVAIVLALLCGHYPIQARDLLEAFVQLFSREDRLSPELGHVIWQLRFPRVLAATMIGAVLAASGATYQGIFRNPLVSPDILGISAGAGLGAAIAIYHGASLFTIQMTAFCGGLIAVGSVYYFSRTLRHHDPVLVLVLAGLAISAMFGAGIALTKMLADPHSQLPAITFWVLGGLNAISQQELLASLPLMLIGLVPLFLLRWRINLLSLSDDEATSLGVNVTRLRAILIFSATLACASAVALAGIIGWVGLVVPHIARLIVGPNFSRLLPASLLIGAVFLIVADTLARSLGSAELPLGMLTAFVGAPAFLWLLARQGARS